MGLRIDYARHPIFRPALSEWTYDQQTVDKFNQLYRDLESGCRPEHWPQLLDTVEDIFDKFHRDQNDFLEDAFISELHLRVVKMIEVHIHYFTAYFKAKNLGTAGLDPATLALFTGTLSSTALSKIATSSRRIIQDLRFAASQGQVERQSLSRNSGLKIRKIIRILNREFNRNGVFDKLALSFPTRTKVVGAAIELSVPDAKWWRNDDINVVGPETLYCHVDEGIDAPKAILYLTDVDESTGPFSYFPNIYENLEVTGIQSLIGRCITSVGSTTISPLFEPYSVSFRRTSSPLFREHFMRLPAEFRFNSHFGWDVIPGSALETFMVDSELSLVGSAGTYLVFDGAQIVHRGGLVQRNQRVVIQVIFGNESFRTILERSVRFLLRKLRS